MAEEKKEQKKFTIADYAKKLNKEFSNDSLMITSNVVPAYRRLDDGFFGIMYPLGGGLPYRRVVSISGLEHSGKTLLACAEVAAYQRENPDKVCVYIDVEHSLDIAFQVMMTHLDQQKLIYYSPVGMSGEQILETILEMEDASDIGMIVLDSLPALMPQTVMENEFAKDMGMRATIAKKLYQFYPAMCDKVAKNGNIMIVINQVRLAGMTRQGIPLYKEAVGSSTNYYASVKIRLGSRVFMKDGEELKSQDGEGATGFRIRGKCVKNKTFNCARGGLFATFDYVTGAEYINDLIIIALKFDFIKRLNNVTYALVDLESGEILKDPETGEELKNKKAYIVEYLNTHDAFRKTYVEMLKKHIMAANDIDLLDKDILNEIDEQERAVTENTEESKTEVGTRQVLLEDQ